MKKFDVEITETLQRKVSVEAASQEDAERMVTQAWNNQDYVLDSGDFTGVDFKTVGEHELAETRTMNVLLVQPNAYPKKISVGTELEDLQAMVGGDIEVTYPFEDEVAIILNESGKINGLPLNRAIYTEDGDIYGIFQQRSNRSSDPRHRTGCRSRHLGSYQPAGRLRQRQPWCQVPGHEAADGRWRCSTDRHDSGAAAFRSVRLSKGCRSEDSDRAAKAACYIVRCRQSPQLAIFCALWQVHMLEVWRRTAV